MTRTCINTHTYKIGKYFVHILISITTAIEYNKLLHLATVNSYFVLQDTGTG